MKPFTHQPNQSPHIEHDIDQAVKYLNSEDIVAVPTETVYGLAANIRSDKAITKIFKLKNRPFFDPLIVHISSAEDALQVVKVFPALAERLSQKFWPGPLTMVLPKRDEVSSLITAGLENVGIRVPNHPVTLELLRRLQSPIAAPSANQFKRTSPTTADHVRREFPNCELMILDGGACGVGIESTVIGFNSDFTEIQVHRPGAVTLEMPSAFAPTHLQKNPAAPGQLEEHYRPQIPLVLLPKNPPLTIPIYEQICQVLNTPHLHPVWLRLPSDPHLAARVLYAELRTAGEKPGKNCILLPYDWEQKNNIWTAITDRLHKAASLKI